MGRNSYRPTDTGKEFEVFGAALIVIDDVINVHVARTDIDNSYSQTQSPINRKIKGEVEGESG